MQYAITYELIQDGMSFTRAVKQLSLSFDEAVALMELIVREKAKKRIYKEQAREHAEFADLVWLDDFVRAPELTPINETITAEEIRRGKEFLAFMGLDHLAAKLEDHQGTGGDFLSIPINHWAVDGWRGLFPHFNVLCGEKLQKMLDAERAERRRRPPAMSRGEMFVRMDPPPGTANPRRVDYRLHVGPAVGQPQHLPMGLHPENFVVTEGGRRYSILDRAWPVRAGLEDADRAAGSNLLLSAAASEAPEFIQHLTIEDVAAMQSLVPSIIKALADVENELAGNSLAMSQPMPATNGWLLQRIRSDIMQEAAF